MPKIRLTKRLAAWTTAVVGTLGSGAGAYTVVGNPWGPEEPAVVAPAEFPANDAKPVQPVPIPDEAGSASGGQQGLATDLPSADRPAMFLDPAVRPVAHAQGSAGDNVYQSDRYEPPEMPAAADAEAPSPAPSFDLPRPADDEPRLPEFQPPTGPEMTSSWAPNPPEESPPPAEQSAIALSPPSPEEPPAEPSTASAESSVALGNALGQAARTTIADAASEPPAGRSLYADAAAGSLRPPPQDAEAPQDTEAPQDARAELGAAAGAQPAARTGSLNFAPRPSAPAAAVASNPPARAFSFDEASDQPPRAPAPLADTPPVASAAASQGDGVPGAETLDGVQAPALTIEKLAPPEIQVGKEATFQIHVRNTGAVAAHEVTVLDRIPQGTKFVTSTPSAAPTGEGQLMWQVGTLQPGEETTVSMQLMPLTEGEIGSVARVVFQAQASVRTLCTRPQLSLTHSGPQKALIGELVVFDITVSNPGSGVATGVVLEEDIPEGLTHAAGRELEFEIGSLRPNETRQLQLTLKAEKPGLVQNEILVRGDANLIAEHAVELEIVAPALEVALDGPKMRYLDRPATYDVVISNPGTAPAREIELVTYLPKGMKFVSADHKGQYEPQNHAVYWSLEELPANQTGAAKLTVLPLQTGEQRLKLEGRAELGLQESFEQVVQVESIAELQFTVSDEADPIEVGAETNYLITLTNSGSSAATNVQLAIRLPPELKPLGGDGPTRVTIDGDQLAIDPLTRIGPAEQAVYRIKVAGQAAGHQRIQVQLATAEMPVAVTREEITRVYDDR